MLAAAATSVHDQGYGRRNEARCAAMSDVIPTAKREVFASRFTFVAAAIGMAVGTGNIWRFPREAGLNGGGAFLIALVVANLVWAIPILMSESLLGSRSRLGAI